MAAAKLSGRICVVTGGGSGIGRAIVDRFVAEGAQVVTCGRRERPADLHADVVYEQVDVSSAVDVDRLASRTQAVFGAPHVLVNNAGTQVEKTVTDSSDEDWNTLMGANAKGVFLACRTFIPVMRGAGGSIINIGSISAQHADPEMALYNASKAFVHGLTRSIAVDHGAEGIRCNAIAPGWIMTEMADSAFELADDPQAAKSDALRRHPVGRFGKPEDIAAMAVWLASDEAAYASGQIFTIDGGMTAASPLQPGFF